MDPFRLSQWKRKIDKIPSICPSPILAPYLTHTCHGWKCTFGSLLSAWNIAYMLECRWSRGGEIFKDPIMEWNLLPHILSRNILVVINILSFVTIEIHFLDNNALTLMKITLYKLILVFARETVEVSYRNSRNDIIINNKMYHNGNIWKQRLIRVFSLFCSKNKAVISISSFTRKSWELKMSHWRFSLNVFTQNPNKILCFIFHFVPKYFIITYFQN